MPALLGLGVGLEICFLALASSPQTPFLPGAAWLGIAALFYLIAVALAVRHKPGSPPRIRLRYVILAAVVFRLTLLPLTPVLSPQIWRFHWDGKIQHERFNPYEYAPRNALFNPVRTAFDENTPNPTIAAYQPPLAESILHWAYDWLGGSVLGLKAVFTAFDLGVIWLLVRMLRERRWPLTWVLVYAWSPLAVVEVSGEGHIVSVGTFFALLALRWARSHRKLAAAALASACSAAWFAITLIATVAAARPAPGVRSRWAGFTAWLIGMSIFWTLPFIWVRKHLGLGLIVRNVRLHALATPVENASLFALFQSWFRHPGAVILALVVLAAVIVLATLQARQPGSHPEAAVSRLDAQNATLRAGFWILGTLLLVLPQVHPWSVLWLLPLVVFWPEPAWIYFSVGVWIAYALPQRPRLIWAEYIPLFLLLLWQAWRPSRTLPCPEPDAAGSSAGAASGVRPGAAPSAAIPAHD